MRVLAPYMPRMSCWVHYPGQSSKSGTMLRPHWSSKYATKRGRLRANISFCFPLHVWVYVCSIYISMHMCVQGSCTHVCMRKPGQVIRFLLLFFVSLPWDRSSHWTWDTVFCLDWPARAPRILVSTPNTWVMGMHGHVHLVCKCWGFKLRSSCLDSTSLLLRKEMKALRD